MTGHFAGFRLLTASYTAAVPALLALILPLPAVGAFHVADRIVRAAAALLQPFTQVSFPRMCTLASDDGGAFRRTLRRVLVGVSLSCAFVATALFVLSVPVTEVVGGPTLQAPAQEIFRMLVWTLLPLGVSTVLGLLWLVPLRRERRFNFCICAGAVVGLLLLLSLPSHFGAVGAAAAVLGGEMSVAMMMLFFYLRSRIHAI
jgi:PST family polysaccharide transporter